MQRQATDEQLCQLAQSGDRDAAEALMRRYEWSVRRHASAFFLPGADRDDVEQEAFLGLLSAVASFDPIVGCSFRSFAFMAIRRKLITAVKMAHRDKHRPLDDSVRVVRNEIGEIEPVVEHLPAAAGDPYDALELKEELQRIRRGAAALTAVERDWLARVLNGLPYTIAGKRNKRADNAIMRARSKLRRAA